MAKHAPSQTSGHARRERRHISPRLFHDSRRRRVGIIGGSFNPAHDGHLHLAVMAKRRLRLDEVWMLVSPQNPLKSGDDMAPLATRVASARNIAQNYDFIKVMCPEVEFRSQHTFKTLTLLKKTSPRMSFIWVMGADNLVQFFAWKQWRRIKCAMPIAVIDRPSYSYRAISAGRKLRSLRLSASQLANSGKDRLLRSSVWCFISGRRHHASATALRALRDQN